MFAFENLAIDYAYCVDFGEAGDNKHLIALTYRFGNLNENPFLNKPTAEKATIQPEIIKEQPVTVDQNGQWIEKDVYVY